MGKILQEGLLTQIEIVTSDAATGILLAALCSIGFALLTILEISISNTEIIGAV